MDSLGSLNVFVRAADARSFTVAGQQLGISSSAVSKAIVRLEERLGIRLFHRSTRTVTLTPEGTLFFERCKRILDEVEAAETELSQMQKMPSGKLKISLPSVGMLFMPKFAAFNRLYPEIKLDISCSDRIVDVIEEGFDAVLRTGDPRDSRLMSRMLGSYRQVIVGSPAYFAAAGFPEEPEDLVSHQCLLYRFPTNGKLNVWPLNRDGKKIELNLPCNMVTDSLEPQVCFAEHGLGIACVPNIAVYRQLKEGSLVTVLDKYNESSTVFRILWPSSRHLSPKVRVFVDFMAENLLPF
ncbi:LysR family transcriptional regulator [Photorhabdus bodei]|uniref:LysR family transcriptional regulator n=1 Tax=Photorhabdus bodei TaxID=2029681 RepID=A0A329XDS4_9GAMM|nr:LysR family transcriptional regulator [Photorhabdus bodei]NDK99197.1 LysR family transcriptional regulator [Photorhabdus bodei]NDL03540.1 LysR family transcriptional regulator [Photorhabdus bodei]NDL07654.1 LysR family transcriptional regulator [Photorhabdus bodei]RAX14605.1 LysR family transcriptional regulator [Photorhabdus bodei]